MFDFSEHGKTLLQFPFTPTGVALCNLAENNKSTLGEMIRHHCGMSTDGEMAYMAEQHGVFGPALFRAELLRGASVLGRHQLLGNAVAVNARVTVFPPVFTQLVFEEELTAWKESEQRLSRSWSKSTRAVLSVLTVAAEVAVLVVDPPGVSGDLLDLAVLTQTRHAAGFLEVV